MFSNVRRVDRLVMFANLGLLLVVPAIPFPTRLLAVYLTENGPNSHIAAAVYSATMLAMGISVSLLWLAVTRDTGLLHEHLDPPGSRSALRRFGAGNIVYAITIGLAFVNAIATLAVHAAIGLYYCFNQLPLAQRRAP